MRKLFTLALLLVLFVVSAFAKPVDENTAKQVGKNFLLSRVSSAHFADGVTLQLAYKATARLNNPQSSIKPNTYFYVFNVNNTQGFVMVSADDDVKPILGYSDENAFDPYKIPNHVAKWMEGYKSQIRHVVENDIEATPEISNEWRALKNNSSTPSGSSHGKKPGSVSPLIYTKWDQGQYYNANCPYDNTESERTVTGCVATSIAQIMRYWSYPETGKSFHSYSHSTYGTLSANFGSTTYQWTSMPNSVTSSNSAVATLMYHVGVAVDMNYGVADQGGSGAYVISAQSPSTHCAEYALKNYFGYDNTSVKGVERDDYTSSAWIALLKSELDASRPIEYAGFGSGGGHAFVCDGYDANDFFHFNWGWSGYYDGYFEVDELNPSGTGTGGGTGSYNTGQQAIIGIKPPSGTITYDLQLTVSLTPNAPQIGYGQSFSVSTNLKNFGNATFEGDYAAAMFDDNGVFVDWVQILTGAALPAGYTYQNNIPFQSGGNLSFLPGTYTAYTFYRPTGGEWEQLSTTDPLVDDFTTIEVINPNDIELNSDVVVTPETLVKGQGATFNLNIINDGATTFTGNYGVGLFNLDGTLAQSIQVINESTGLQSGHTYQSPYLTFSTSAVTVEPGTYIFAVQHNDGTGWQLTGSSYHQNPIKVIVKEAPLQADKYEVNNAPGSAYKLPVSFTNNAATVNTTGSNCHMGNDYDYYKIELPAGYDYTITTRLHDAGSSTDGNTYTLDALFSFLLDGSSWSEAYDDVMAGNIEIKDGGTVYFLVSPFFTGEIGTYLLNSSITRTPIYVPSSEKEILTFTADSIIGNAAINSGSATIELMVSGHTDITKLAPQLTISPLASVSPPSGLARDFTTPLTYTVTAEDGSKKVWTVTVEKEIITSIGREGNEGIKVYPNPASDNIYVSLNDFDGQVSRVDIYNVSGQKVTDYKVVRAEQQYKLDVSTLAAGTYFLNIESSQGQVMKQITVK